MLNARQGRLLWHVAGREIGWLNVYTNVKSGSVLMVECPSKACEILERLGNSEN